MGCDYYVITTLHVGTKDGKMHEFEFNRDSKWVFPWDDDDDDESWEERLEKAMKEHETTKVLFRDPDWQIKNQGMIDRYLEFLAKQIPSFSSTTDIQTITRVKTTEERF